MPVERTSAGSPAHRIGGKSSRVLTPAQACGVAAVGLAALENLLVALTASRPRRRGNRCEGSREAAEGEEALRLAVAPILRHLKSAAAALAETSEPAGERPTDVLELLTREQRAMVRVWIEKNRRIAERRP
jgi:hypothetical protein